MIDLLEALKLEMRGSQYENDDALLQSKLFQAKSIAMERLYPFSDWPDELPARYQHWQLRAAVELVNRIGSEGQVSHAENGVSRSYNSGTLSRELLEELIPYVGVVR